MDVYKPLDVGRPHVPAPLRAAVRRARDGRGRAVQIDPIKLPLKPPEIKCLNLKCNRPLSSFGFNLRRYTVVGDIAYVVAEMTHTISVGSHGKCSPRHAMLPFPQENRV